MVRVLLVALAALATSLIPAAPAMAQSGSPPPPGYTLVGLGDSLPGAMLCDAPCQSYVEIFGELAADALGSTVATQNLATNDGNTSGNLAGLVARNPHYRDAVAGADLVTLQIGINDWQGSCMFDGLTDCLTSTAATAVRNVELILDEIVALRDGAPTAIRVVTYYDPFVGAERATEWWGFDPSERDAFEEGFGAALTEFNAGLCRAAAAHDALCIDTRTPINGPGWDIEALPTPADGALIFGGDDHIHFTAAGHELVAQAIAAAGFAPLGGPPASPVAWHS